MQQIVEQCGMQPGFLSREPTHWIMTTLRGVCCEEGISSFPRVGPLTASRRASSCCVITPAYFP